MTTRSNFSALREILLVVLTKRSQLYLFLVSSTKNFVKLTNAQKSMELSMLLVLLLKN